MDGVIRKIDCWPALEQELLLKAAVQKGNEAVSAWEKWNSSVDIERIDAGSHNLLPLLYHNLNTLGIKHPLMSKLKGIYRQTWYKNQLAIQRMSILLTAFHDEGMETMVLKGAALTLLYYKNHGVRPMGDIDILVHTEQAKEAINLMIKSGWISDYKSPENLILMSHGVPFKSPATDQVIDLHWHVLHEGRQSRADEKFWKGAVSFKIGDVTTCTLNPTDQLLHAFVHGIKWNSVPPLRWVADAMTILNSSPSEVDWNRLIALAKEHRLVLPTRDGLNYLRDKLDAPIPEAVLKAINNIPTSRLERIEYRYKTHNHEQKPLGYMPIIWFDYSRIKGDQALPLKLIGFIQYLKSLWGVESIWQLPLYAISMTTRRIQTVLDHHRKRPE